MVSASRSWTYASSLGDWTGLQKCQPVAILLSNLPECLSSAFANSECSQFKNPCMVLSGISLMHTYVEAEGPEALQTGKQFGRPMMSATLWM